MPCVLVCMFSCIIKLSRGGGGGKAPLWRMFSFYPGDPWPRAPPCVWTTARPGRGGIKTAALASPPRHGAWRDGCCDVLR